MSIGRNHLIAALCVLFLFSGTSCSNNPYTSDQPTSMTTFSSFSTPPLQLDPAEAYWSHQGQIIDQIYEPPLSYHYLKRPFEVIPLTATGVPSPVYFNKRGKKIKKKDPPADDVGRVEYVIQLKPGILYQDHPCFAKDSDGEPCYRNLTKESIKAFKSIDDFPRKATRVLKAEDYVLQIFRIADPRIHCPIFATLERYILGFEELREEVDSRVNEERERRKATIGATYNRERDERENPIRIDYLDLECEGVKIIDELTYKIVLKEKYPPFRFWLCMHFFAPVPEEAMDFYEQPAMVGRQFVLGRCPIGTGPYYLKTFKQNELMVLQRNQNYHEDRYPSEGEPGDAENGLLDDAGKKLPFIDTQYIRYEHEEIPRWNKFFQGYYDASGISDDVFDKVISTSDELGSHLSENMSSKGVSLIKYVDTSLFYWAFNMLDPVVGGYTEEHRKLRQAISIVMDPSDYLEIFANGRGVPAQGPVPPGIFGYRKEAEGTNPFVDKWDPARKRHVRRRLEDAEKLMTEAGYPGGIGQDGRPLVLHWDHASAGDADFPIRFRWCRRRLALLGIQLEQRGTDLSQFQVKRRKGNWQMVFSGWLADYPDPENFLFLFYGPNSKVVTGGVNVYNYQNKDYDSLFRQMATMDNGDSRRELIDKMVNILQQDAPCIWFFHREPYSLYHSWYSNVKPHPVSYNTTKYRRVVPDVRVSRQKEWNQPILWPLYLLLGLTLSAVVPAALGAYKRERGLKK